MERERRRRREEEEEEEEEERMKKEKNRNGGGKEKMGKETLRWRIGVTGVIYGAAQHKHSDTGGMLTAAKIEIPVGYHTIPYVPNQTQCSVSTRIQGSFFFFFFFLSRELELDYEDSSSIWQCMSLL